MYRPPQQQQQMEQYSSPFQAQPQSSQMQMQMQMPMQQQQQQQSPMQMQMPMQQQQQQQQSPLQMQMPMQPRMQQQQPYPMQQMQMQMPMQSQPPSQPLVIYSTGTPRTAAVLPASAPSTTPSSRAPSSAPSGGMSWIEIVFAVIGAVAAGVLVWKYVLKKDVPGFLSFLPDWNSQSQSTTTSTSSPAKTSTESESAVASNAGTATSTQTSATATATTETKNTEAARIVDGESTSLRVINPLRYQYWGIENPNLEPILRRGWVDLQGQGSPQDYCMRIYDSSKYNASTRKYELGPVRCYIATPTNMSLAEQQKWDEQPLPAGWREDNWWRHPSFVDYDIKNDVTNKIDKSKNVYPKLSPIQMPPSHKYDFTKLPGAQNRMSEGGLRVVHADRMKSYGVANPTLEPSKRRGWVDLQGQGSAQDFCMRTYGPFSRTTKTHLTGPVRCYIATPVNMPLDEQQKWNEQPLPPGWNEDTWWRHPSFVDYDIKTDELKKIDPSKHHQHHVLDVSEIPPAHTYDFTKPPRADHRMSELRVVKNDRLEYYGLPNPTLDPALRRGWVDLQGQGSPQDYCMSMYNSKTLDRSTWQYLSSFVRCYIATPPNLSMAESQLWNEQPLPAGWSTETWWRHPSFVDYDIKTNRSKEFQAVKEAQNYSVLSGSEIPPPVTYDFDSGFALNRLRVVKTTRLRSVGMSNPNLEPNKRRGWVDLQGQGSAEDFCMKESESGPVFCYIATPKHFSDAQDEPWNRHPLPYGWKEDSWWRDPSFIDYDSPGSAISVETVSHEPWKHDFTKI